MKENDKIVQKKILIDKELKEEILMDEDLGAKIYELLKEKGEVYKILPKRFVLVDKLVVIIPELS